MTVIFILIVLVLAFIVTAVLTHMHLGGAMLFGYSPFEIQMALVELSTNGNDLVLFESDGSSGHRLANLYDHWDIDDLPNGHYTMVAKRDWETLDKDRTYSDREVTADKDDPGVYIVFTKSGRELTVLAASSGYGCEKYSGLYVADRKCAGRIATLYEVYAHSHYRFICSI